MSASISNLLERPAFHPEKGCYKYIICLVDPVSDGTSYSIFVEVLGPGETIDTHEHSQEEQVFFVLHGEARIQAGDAFYHCKAGEYARVPAGIKHGIYNDSSERLYLYITTIPDSEFSEWLYSCEPAEIIQEDLDVLTACLDNK